MTLAAETVTQQNSGLVFDNTYGAGVTDAFRGAILTAEHELQSLFTNSITVKMTFDLQPLSAQFDAQNTYSLVGVTYADYTAALAAHATTASDKLAVAGLPQADPSHGVGFWITSAEARVLGLSTEAKAVDDSVTLNSTQWPVIGSDTVSTLVHEMSEGVFGRDASLGITRTGWQPMDLFRFNAQGQHDYTGGADGQAAYFGVDGSHLSTMEFHNAISPNGANDGSELGDWNNSADTFGPGGAGVVGVLSNTDQQILDILGWTPASPVAPDPAPAAPVTIAAAPGHDVPDMNVVAHSMWGGWVDL